MDQKPIHFRLFAIAVSIMLFAIALSLLMIAATVPSSIADTLVASPLGTVAVGSVTVGNSAVPTGTTFFSEDRITSNEPALLTFEGGSRIEMTKAQAAFIRQGETLIVGANRGLLRFNFKKGENVQIDAGKFQFTGVDNADHIGELGLNIAGEVAMNVSAGTFIALNTDTGVRMEVAPNSPMVVTNEDSAADVATKAGLSTPAKVLIIAGVAGAGTGLGIGIYEAVKSPSSR